MPRLGTWIGASTADVAVRLTTQLFGTAVIARLLPAEDFGLAMMVLSVVALLGAFVGLPFEEALAQRRRISVGHLRSALFVSLALSVAAVLLVLAVAPTIARQTGAPSLATWLPVATAFLVGQAPGSIARAIARRHRRFVELAVCQSLSVIVATVAAIALAYAGAGVLALVLQRMLPVVLYPLFAAVSIKRSGRSLLRPVFIRDRFAEIFRFSWIYLTDTGVHYAAPAAMTFVVNAQFGTVVLGQLNIGMRLAEPLRLGIQSVGHNLVFSILSRMQEDPRRLVQSALDVVTRMAALAVPAFVGLAVVARFLLPILVGPGWEGAISLARAWCLVAAVNVPFLYLLSGFSALGRPEFGLAASSINLVVLLVGLFLAARVGLPAGIGFAALAAEIAVAGWGLVIAGSYVGGGVLTPLLRIVGIWSASALMATALLWVAPAAWILNRPVVALVVTVVAGAVLYPPLLFVFCRPCFAFFQGLLRGRKGQSL